MKALGVDGKLVADQLGHSLDFSQNVYKHICRKQVGWASRSRLRVMELDQWPRVSFAAWKCT